MAAGDFADLQLQLAKLAGRPTAADLDDDLDLCKQVINEAYLGCYMLPDGTRPPWARMPFGLHYAAPATANLVLTQGSVVFTGMTPGATKIGSSIVIGQNVYTYAGLNGANEELVEPFQEASGTYAATLYHDSQPVSARAVDIVGNPQRIGYGPLSPMSDRETWLMYRSKVRGDFAPAAGQGSINVNAMAFGGIAYNSGGALFYFLDSSSLLASASIQHRMCLCPGPAAATTVRFDATVTPVELSADADVPKLVGNLVTRILLPIARAEWVGTYKKFAGSPETKAAIMRHGAEARSLLLTLGTPQRRFSGVARPGRC